MKQIRFLVLLMAAFLLTGLFAGCNTNAGTVTPTPSSQSGSPSSTPATETPGSELPYPKLSAEPVEVTVWQTFSANYIASMNDSEFVNYLEEVTNVRLKFKEASPADASTAFNLMINSGDYADIIRPESLQYPGGPDKAIADGVYLRLNEYIEKYAPNYAAKRTVTPDVARQTITDSGNIWSMYTLNDPAEYPWNGLALRGDILEKKGLDLPVTLNDWENAFKAFMDEGVEYPLLFDMSGVSLNSEFLSAFQIGKEFFQKNGKVYYGYIEPEFKEYLTLMNDWYNKGYIDREFTTRGVNFAIFGGDPLTQILNGKSAAGLFPWGYTANAKAVDGSTTIEGFYLSPVSAPVRNVGDTIHFRFTSPEAKTPNAVSTACENVELVIRLMDYLYTDEGALLMNYGKEGISYTMQDGKPVYTDIILKNPDGFSFDAVLYKYTWFDGVGMGDFKRLWQGFIGTPAEKALDAYNVWNKDKNDYMLPIALTMTAEEGQEYSVTYGDIQTYVYETIPQFIIGSKPISEFDDFVNQIKAMGIDRCIELQQNALDRYNAR
ncbi:MAG: extracellular solute-binding protein [Clostridiales bacterium]|nr:extracellular solute-binding protein [Clostridiales bacterium]